MYSAIREKSFGLRLDRRKGRRRDGRISYKSVASGSGLLQIPHVRGHKYRLWYSAPHSPASPGIFDQPQPGNIHTPVDRLTK